MGLEKNSGWGQEWAEIFIRGTKYNNAIFDNVKFSPNKGGSNGKWRSNSPLGPDPEPVSLKKEVEASFSSNFLKKLQLTMLSSNLSDHLTNLSAI